MQYSPQAVLRGVDESGSYRYGFVFVFFAFSGAKDR